MSPKPKSKLKQKKFRDGLATKLDRIENRQIKHHLENKNYYSTTQDLLYAVEKLLKIALNKDNH